LQKQNASLLINSSSIPFYLPPLKIYIFHEQIFVASKILLHALELCCLGCQWLKNSSWARLQQAKATKQIIKPRINSVVFFLVFLKKN
jgi:hypothetical protein